MSTHTRRMAEAVEAARDYIANRDPGFPGDHLKDVVTVDGHTVELLHRGGGAFRLTAGADLSDGPDRTDSLTVNGVTYDVNAEMEHRRDGRWHVADWRTNGGYSGSMWHVSRADSFNGQPTDAAARKLRDTILPELAAKAAAACPDFGGRQDEAAEHRDRGQAHRCAWRAIRALDDVLADLDRKEN